LDDQSESAELKEPGNSSPKRKIWTVIGHSSGLAAFVGVFISASAFSTDPRSGMVKIGVVLAVIGAVGFAVARRMGKRRGK
jgi:uncharacterized membrane protein